MSLFHKHKYRLISAQDESGQEWSFVLSKFITSYKETVIIDICDECKHFRTRRLSGHHAKNINEGYEVEK